MLEKESRDQLGLEIAKRYFSREIDNFDYSAFRYALESCLRTLAPRTPDQISKMLSGEIDVRNLDKVTDIDKWRYSISNVDELIAEAIMQTTAEKKLRDKIAKEINTSKILASPFFKDEELPLLEYPPFEVTPDLIPTPFFSKTHYIYRISYKEANTNLYYLRDTTNKFYFRRLFEIIKTYHADHPDDLYNGKKYGYLIEEPQIHIDDQVSFGVFGENSEWTYFLKLEDSGFDWGELTTEAKQFVVALEKVDLETLNQRPR